MQIRMQMFEGAHCLTNYFTHCFSGVALRMEGDVAGYVDELIGHLTMRLVQQHLEINKQK